MGIITKMLKQTAILWKISGSDGQGGFTFSAPVEINCRWEDRIEIFVDLEGKEQRSNSVVYVDRDLDIDDYLQLADLESSTPSDPVDVVGAFPVRRFDNLPNFKATEYLRTAYL